MSDHRDIVIVGGGLAGLTSAILLTKSGFKVSLVEKKKYPFHRVCGEYISNEVKQFLQRQGLFPMDLDLPEIRRFGLSSVSGSEVIIELPLGGFGVSRYSLDNFLFLKAKTIGCEVIEGCEVLSIKKESSTFIIDTGTDDPLVSKIVIGAYGKRSKLDKTLERKFIRKQSPYVGVKYHLKTEHPQDLIKLHNFKNGYCGISQVEGDKHNLCYLSHRSNFKQSRSVRGMEEEVMYKNPHLRSIFKNSDFLFEKPLVINEISFAAKPLVENGIFMCGDSAGMITPLCGNGMSIAIHSAYLLSNAIADHHQRGDFRLENVERKYRSEWKKFFKVRLTVGRKLQGLFGGEFTSEIALMLMRTPLGKEIVKLTHGKPIS